MTGCVSATEWQETNERREFKNAVENKKMGEKKKSGRCRGQRRGVENRRGMLCWRTGRGKPQEGVRGREVERERERKRSNKNGEGEARLGRRASKVSCERRVDSHARVNVRYTRGGIHSLCVSVQFYI